VYLGIKQDDDKDWQEAAVTMASIYEHGYLTIAATWSSGSSYGLFAPDQHLFDGKKLQSCGIRVRKKPPHFPFLWQSTPSWPLLDRAWVYQERLLSPRTVHFGENQVRDPCAEPDTMLHPTIHTADPRYTGSV
jgi:hypothetical protein